MNNNISIGSSTPQIPSIEQRSLSTRTIDEGNRVVTETCEAVHSEPQERSSNIQGNSRIADRLTTSSQCSWQIRYKTSEEIGRDLRKAIQEGDVDAIKRLLPGSIVRFTGMLDSQGNTPMHAAVEKGNKDIVELFLKKRAGISTPNLQGLTPAHVAIEKGNTEIAKLIISYTLNVNVEDSQGNTLLHLAAANGNEEIVTILLNHRLININAKNSQGRSPLDLSAGKENITNLLRARGAAAAA